VGVVRRHVPQEQLELGLLLCFSSICTTSSFLLLLLLANCIRCLLPWWRLTACRLPLCCLCRGARLR
jgi:hypothetical protein